MERSAESLLPDVPNDSAEIGEVKAEPRCMPAQGGVVFDERPRDVAMALAETVPRSGWSFRTPSVARQSAFRLAARMTLGLTYRTESGRCRADTRPGPWEGPRDEEFILGTGQDGRSWGRIFPLAIP